MESRVKYLEETVSILTVSFFTLQGQLLDMIEEMNDMKEESEDESEDETIVTDESVVEEPFTEKKCFCG